MRKWGLWSTDLFALPGLCLRDDCAVTCMQCVYWLAVQLSVCLSLWFRLLVYIIGYLNIWLLPGLAYFSVLPSCSPILLLLMHLVIWLRSSEKNPFLYPSTLTAPLNCLCPSHQTWLPEDLISQFTMRSHSTIPPQTFAS